MPSNLTIMTTDDLAEALTVLDENPNEWKIFAGGTDLMVQIHQGKSQATKYLDISNFDDLKKIEISESEIRIGALVTYDQIQRSDVLNREFPNICQAARETGAIAIQNRGTIGGNIANASPAADTPPALLSYDTDVELISTAHKRRIPYREFHHGYKAMDLRPDEIIKGIVLKRGEKTTHHYYRKVGTRKAQAISKTVIAATANIDSKEGKPLILNIKISFGSVAPTPLHCQKLENFLTGKPVTDSLIDEATQKILEEISPIEDVRSNANFRNSVSQNILREFLEALR